MRRSYFRLLEGLLFSLPLLFASCGNGDNALEEIINGGGSGGSTSVTSISLNESTLNMTVGGADVTLTATVDPAGATVSWSSDNEAAATVADGVVHAVAMGTAIITAKAGDKSATCTVTVKIPGLLAGVFSVSATEKVQFSQGNLQAKIASYASNAATASEWKFADSQYSYIGDAAGNNSFAVDSWVDLFSWVGESANNDTYGLITFESSTQANHGNNPSESLKTDWGKLAISNGGNTANSGWRTLTGGDSGEWKYLFDSRTTATTNMPDGTNNSEARYTKATVAGVSGIILFPDNYAHPAGVTVTVSEAAYNTASKAYTTFTVDATNWSTMETVGCVFLPAASDRYGTTLYGAGLGRYWSSTVDGASGAYSVGFSSGGLNPAGGFSRVYGHSVRLVRDVAE